MRDAVNSAKPIKLFLASPSDVKEEREALSGLVREINDVLAFLVPEHGLRLELVRYETHTYPDIGPAQAVINRQIPLDYDIFIGVMWKRCGTPTASAQSGTIEEFNRAVSRREQTGRPTIMFYFCDEPVPLPRGEDLEQLNKVIRFREKLEEKGYTLSYPSRAVFRDYVRGGVLRAVADILGADSRAAKSLGFSATRIRPADEDQDEVASLAASYDEVRKTMLGGRDRTKKMTEITARMRLRCAAVRAMLPEYQKSASAGLRLAALCILQQFPNVAEIDWLVDRLDPDKEKPFVGYQAAVAFAQAVRSLPTSDYSVLGKAIREAISLAKKNPHDPPRISVLTTALGELQMKSRAGQG